MGRRERENTRRLTYLSRFDFIREDKQLKAYVFECPYCHGEVPVDYNTSVVGVSYDLGCVETLRCISCRREGVVFPRTRA